MPTHAYTLIFDGLADWESAYALCALARSGKYQLRTVGHTRSSVRTMAGFSLTPDLSLDQLDETQAAIFVLPGGAYWETPEALQDAGLLELVQRLHQKGVVIAAICGATTLAAAAGLTHATRHTSNSPDTLKAMVPGYADQAFYLDAQAVCDNALITASVTGSLEFAREIMWQLKLETEGDIDAWYRMFKGCAQNPAPASTLAGS